MKSRVITQHVRLLIPVFAVIFVFVLYAEVRAHSSGASVELESGTYLVDIGYEPETISAGTQVRLDFSLLNATSSETEDFSDMWLRVEKDNALYFAGGIPKSRFGATGVSYRFSDSGTYEFTIRFQNGADTLTEVSFPLEVGVGSTEEKDGNNILLALALLCVGLIGGFIAGRATARV